MGNIQKMKHPYGYVANSIINDEKLSFNAKGIYLYILSKPDNWDFSQKRISQSSVTSEYSVKTAIKELELAELLEREKQQNGRVIYKIKDPVQECVFQKSNTTFGECVSQKSNSQHADSQHADTGGVSKKEQVVIKKESKKDSIPFDNFWDVYPKKQDKVKAKKKWDRLSFDIQEEILVHIQGRKGKDRQWLDGYIPMPTTFLNGERWEDEYEVEEEGQGIVNLDNLK